MITVDYLAQAVVERLEQAHTCSAAVLRLRVYNRLRELLGPLIVLDLVERVRHAFVLECEAKVKRARTRRAEREAQLDRVKQRRPPVWPTAPTPEHVRAAGEAPEEVEVVAAAGPVKAMRAHRWPWAVDRLNYKRDDGTYKSLLTGWEYAAAEHIRWAYETRNGRPAISDYGTATRRSDPTRRLGLPPDQEHASDVWHMYWGRLNPTLQPVVWALVLQQPLPGQERAPTLEEFGRWYGNVDDARRARGIAEGALRAACSVLAEIATGLDAWRVKQIERERQAAIALQTKSVLASVARKQHEGARPTS